MHSYANWFPKVGSGFVVFNLMPIKLKWLPEVGEGLVVHEFNAHKCKVVSWSRCRVDCSWRTCLWNQGRRIVPQSWQWGPGGCGNTLLFHQELLISSGASISPRTWKVIKNNLYSYPKVVAKQLQHFLCTLVLLTVI